MRAVEVIVVYTQMKRTQRGEPIALLSLDLRQKTHGDSGGSQEEPPGQTDGRIQDEHEGSEGEGDG
jgi:hypothetical protein